MYQAKLQKRRCQRALIKQQKMYQAQSIELIAARRNARKRVRRSKRKATKELGKRVAAAGATWSIGVIPVKEKTANNGIVSLALRQSVMQLLALNIPRTSINEVLDIGVGLAGFKLSHPLNRSTVANIDFERDTVRMADVATKIIEADNATALTSYNDGTTYKGDNYQAELQGIVKDGVHTVVSLSCNKIANKTAATQIQALNT
eukprot:1158636-Prorocentrum_minimum.AAC.1